MTRSSVQGGALSLVLAIAFANAARAQTTQNVPLPWKSADVDAPAMAGFANGDGRAFSILAAGTGIAGSRDQFHYVYQPIQGDVEIVARLVSLQARTALARGGLMIRETLLSSSRHAFMSGSMSNGWSFRRRLSSGGGTYTTADPSGVVPGWIKLTREGSLFTAFHSTNGSTWRVVDSDVITMPSTVYIGLAATSSDPGTMASSYFDNVVVRRPAGSNQPPSVAIASPSSGATFTVGQTINVAATATDADGSVSRVDFFGGSSLSKSDTTSPFTAPWIPTTAGTYSLSATAYDDDGLSSTARPVSITVVPTTRAATIKFTPSTDHNTNVTSYAVAIYRAADAVTVSPVTSQPLGKPSPVNGSISVDISTLIARLPAGSYKAVVTATGTGGSTPSDPSAVFSF